MISVIFASQIKIKEVKEAAICNKETFLRILNRLIEFCIVAVAVAYNRIVDIFS